MKVLYELSYLGLNYADAALLTGIPRTQDRILRAAFAAEGLEPFCGTLENYAAQLYLAAYLRREWPAARPKLFRVWETPGVPDRLARLLAARLRRGGGGPRGGSAAEQALIRPVFNATVRAARWRGVQQRFDVFHSLYYGLPPRGAVDARARVLSVYDLAPIRFPAFFPAHFNFEHFRGIMRSVVPGQDHVIACSAATAADFCDFTGIDAQQVHVVPLAASRDIFHPAEDPRSVAGVRRKYGIPSGPYLLALFTLEPRKNTDGLVRAFAELLRRQAAGGATLVIAGAIGWDAAIEQRLRIDAALRRRIVLTGRVPDDEMSPLYSGATAFVYPSFYEGFGLPVLEAMQCGVPVISSNTSSLPEVVGDAGLLVDPHDHQALAAAMQALLGDAARRAALSRAGLERARRFSWERTIAEVTAVYRTALSQAPEACRA